MERLEKAFRSRQEFEAQIRMIRHFLSLQKCGREELLFVAINEAVNNALFHGNRNDPSKYVRLKMSRQGACLFIFVQDEGKRLDEELFLQQTGTRKKNLLAENGRGFMIIKGCCDSLSFPEPGTMCMMAMLEEGNIISGTGHQEKIPKTVPSPGKYI